MRFLRRVLLSLNRTYDFEGSRIMLDQFELGTPIQPVHDVSAESAFQSGGGVVTGSMGAQLLPWFEVELTQIHSGTGGLQGSLGPYTVFGIDPNKFTCWVHSVWGSASVNSNFTEAWAFIQQAAPYPDVRQLVYRSSALVGNVPSGAYPQVPSFQHPRLIPLNTSGANIFAGSEVTGANTIRTVVRLLIVPRGVPPRL